MNINNLMFFAAKHGNLALLKQCVKDGADMHANNDEALHWAAKHGHLEVVKYLVNKGANIHSNSILALYWAAEIRTMYKRWCKHTCK